MTIQPPRRRKAFTLVEILIVVSIITVLAGMLIPVLSSARASARDTVCVANLKAIGTALLLYVQEHDHYLPACGPDQGDTGAYQVWYRAMAPFVENWQAFECPSKPSPIRDVPQELKGDSPADGTKFRAVNYGMNYQFPDTDPESDLMGGSIQIDVVVSPSLVLFIADGALYSKPQSAGSINVSDELPDSIVDGALCFPDRLGSLPSGAATVSARHRGHTMCLFLDGHVKPIETEKILLPERGDPDCIYDGEMYEF